MRTKIRAQLRRKKARLTTRYIGPEWLRWAPIIVPLTRGEIAKLDRLIATEIDKVEARINSSFAFTA